MSARVDKCFGQWAITSKFGLFVFPFHQAKNKKEKRKKNVFYLQLANKSKRLHRMYVYVQCGHVQIEKREERKAITSTHAPKKKEKIEEEEEGRSKNATNKKPGQETSKVT